jgi:hypothetical protein
MKNAKQAKWAKFDFPREKRNENSAIYTKFCQKLQKRGKQASLNMMFT